MFKFIFLLICIAVVAMIAYDVVRIYFLFKKTQIIEKAKVSFSRLIENAPKNILVLGDSTAVGTGAERPEDTTAGRLGRLFPDAQVVNISKNGLKIAGLNKILDMIDEGARFDIVLIQIGANDIIQLTSMNNIKAGIDQILTRAAAFKGKTIIMHSGNIGESAFFPWYIKPILSIRSQAVREVYRSAAAKHAAQYIDLIDSVSSSLLKENPSKYYAADLLHLTGDGYGTWFNEIRKQSNITAKAPIDIVK